MAASGLAYIKALIDAGAGIDVAISRVALGLAADADYFSNIAKVRAAKTVWARIAGALSDKPHPIHIEARSSRRMLSTLDPWVNMLRLTSAAFGASVGGADAIVLDQLHPASGTANTVLPAAGAQRPARPDGGGAPRPRDRSGRGRLVSRDPHRPTRPRRLGRFPGYRGGGGASSSPSCQAISPTRSAKFETRAFAIFWTKKPRSSASRRFRALTRRRRTSMRQTPSPSPSRRPRSPSQGWTALAPP